MVFLEDIHKFGKELEQWLRMRVHIIAIKMLKNENEIPEEAIIPTRDWGHKYALCQSLARSQRDGLTIAMFKNDMWCFEPVVGFGFSENISNFLEGEHCYPDSVRDPKFAPILCGSMPRINYGEYMGIVSAPIHTCTFMPDVIFMHVNGMMANQLLIIKNWIDGKDLYAQLSGHASCVYAIVPPIQNHECTIAIPCKGDRRLAFAQDDEIIFSLVPELLPEFIDGIKFLEENKWGLPMIQEYKEEYAITSKYVELSQKLGMNLNKSIKEKS
jgi:uncharacterized protein (DUF169 family)